jgi:hypothetical protein
MTRVLPIFLLLCLCLGLAAQVIVQPVLSLSQIQLTNAPILQFIDADPQIGGSGGGSFSETTYTGPVYLLSAQFLVDGRWVVEYSMDLQDWQPYPSPGCMLTLTPTNTSGVIFSGEPTCFFRVRNLPW